MQMRASTRHYAARTIYGGQYIETDGLVSSPAVIQTFLGLPHHISTGIRARGAPESSDVLAEVVRGMEVFFSLLSPGKSLIFYLISTGWPLYGCQATDATIV